MRHFLLLVAALAVATGCAWAGNTEGGICGDPPLPLDGTWYTGAVYQSGEIQTWTYTAARPVVFTVTDAYQTGDYSDVFLDGGWVFSTPDVPETGDWIGDLDAAYADARWSSGYAVLPAGSHSVDVQFWVDAMLPAHYGVQGTLVPEPSSLVLLSVGPLGTLLPLPLRRRK